MLNFPVPYPDELVYSIIARAGIHLGITSPKQLLDEVFSDRKVIATIDLPCHLKSVSSQYPASQKLTVDRLAYQHTLFPIYAPFVAEDTRKHCLHWMEGKSLGAIHLALGVAASRVRQGQTLRYCPKCMEKQLVQYGEYYWDRKWQVSGANCCIEHGSLINALVERRNYHRHCFVALTTRLFNIVAQSNSTEEAECITRSVDELLTMAPFKSPSFEQWSKFYKSLASDLNYTRGKFIQFDAIKNRFTSHWNNKWLKNHGLQLNDGQACWLRSIFRKHRKSFSYLEHITVLDTFLSPGWSIADVLKDVLSLKVRPQKSASVTSIEVNCNDEVKNKRERWEIYLKKYGVRKSRYSGGGGLYAWLYRYDRDWLLLINRRYPKHIEMKNDRVDWSKRDRDVVKELIQLKNMTKQKVDLPRRSKNWYLSQITYTSTIAKNMDRLPLVRMFLVRYAEDVATYQTRRIIRSIEKLKTSNTVIKRWRVLRLSGLSGERLTDKAEHYLKKAIMD